ncbi:MAG TPA: NAD(P)H-quinone oxidoreductase [Candidatus Solibacter sp.]|nr:NAD(P)H-quinone oxidoreductase [Candidatus Solibacter sp.]
MGIEMRYIDFPQPGPPDVLRIAEAPTPTPGDREVLIHVEAAGVNRSDIAQRLGKYPPPPGASPVLGLEVAGTIASVGAGSRWKAGDRVCALVPGGGYAEYCLTPDPQCLPIPKGLSMEEAAGIPETFFTVWANVFQIGRLEASERILIHGGASGVGTAAIQLARAFGATVFVTAGSPAKCEACVKLGANAAIDYLKQDFVQEIRKLTPHGVELILDMVGGPYTLRNIEALAMHGRLVQIAVQQGAEATINLAKIMQKRLIVTGSTMRPRSVDDKGRIASELHERVWPLLESGAVKVIVDRVFPFDDVAGAHRYLESGAHIGKVILKVV